MVHHTEVVLEKNIWDRNLSEELHESMIWTFGKWEKKQRTGEEEMSIANIWCDFWICWIRVLDWCSSGGGGEHDLVAEVWWVKIWCWQFCGTLWQAHKKEAKESDVCGILEVLYQSAHQDNSKLGHLILEQDVGFCEMEKVGAIFLNSLPFEIKTLLNQTSSGRFLLFFLQTLTTFFLNTHCLHAETYGWGSCCPVF